MSLAQPGNITVDATNPAGATASYANPAATDPANPHPPTAICTPASGSVFAIGYRSLTELASDWYWEQDEKGDFSKVSGPVLEMLGIRVDNLAGGSSSGQMAGWDNAKRSELLALIAARQPFLDFVVSRTKPNGTQQHFRVSGEPMFNKSCSFIGYRGIGVETTAKE